MSARDVLLPEMHNPRRCLRKPVLLVSDHNPTPHFITVSASGEALCSAVLVDPLDPDWLDNAPGIQHPMMLAKWDAVRSLTSTLAREPVGPCLNPAPNRSHPEPQPWRTASGIFHGPPHANARPHPQPGRLVQELLTAPPYPPSARRLRCARSGRHRRPRRPAWRCWTLAWSAFPRCSSNTRSCPRVSKARSTPDAPSTPHNTPLPRPHHTLTAPVTAHPTAHSHCVAPSPHAAPPLWPGVMRAASDGVAEAVAAPTSWISRMLGGWC